MSLMYTIYIPYVYYIPYTIYKTTYFYSEFGKVLKVNP